MNKAFVKESDGDEEEGQSAPSLPPGSKNYMTRRGFLTLKAELKELL